MAIDTSNVTNLITEFRKITAKDGISPESLGSLLQSITNLLNNVTSDADVERATQTVNFILSLPHPLQTFTQGSADRNNILLSTTHNRYDMGAPLLTADAITIKQATTERAGAMRAQHVNDLYDCKSAIKELQSLASILQGNVATLQDQATDAEIGINDLVNTTSANATNISTLQTRTNRLDAMAHGQISLQVIYDRLYVSGYAELAAEGYVPYLFRRSKRKNRVTDLVGEVQRQDIHKGWHMMGRDNMLQVSNGLVSFNTKDRYMLTKLDEPDVYSTKAMDLVNPDLDKHRIPWGHSPIFIDNYIDSSPRLIMLDYAIAFGPRLRSAREVVKPSNMVTNLATFKVAFFNNNDAPYAAFIKP